MNWVITPPPPVSDLLFSQSPRRRPPLIPPPPLAGSRAWNTILLYAQRISFFFFFFFRSSFSYVLSYVHTPPRVDPAANNNRTQSNYPRILNTISNARRASATPVSPVILLTRFGVNAVLKIKVIRSIPRSCVALCRGTAGPGDRYARDPARRGGDGKFIVFHSNETRLLSRARRRRAPWGGEVRGWFLLINLYSLHCRFAIQIRNVK